MWEDRRRRATWKSTACPSALRVAAEWPRCRSTSTMRPVVASVVASRIRSHRARHDHCRIYEQGY
jgi:hypothetical protein